MILKLILGLVIDGGFGFAWYKFVGCSPGACPLTSHLPLNSLAAAAVGALVVASFR